MTRYRNNGVRHQNFTASSVYYNKIKWDNLDIINFIAACINSPILHHIVMRIGLHVSCSTTNIIFLKILHQVEFSEQEIKSHTVEYEEFKF
jgi:hypothetical protein